MQTPGDRLDPVINYRKIGDVPFDVEKSVAGAAG
jgi:hypothetical protein